MGKRKEPQKKKQRRVFLHIFSLFSCLSLTPLKMTSRPVRVVVLGEPGCGRTSLIMKFEDPSFVVARQPRSFWVGREQNVVTQKTLERDDVRYEVTVVEVPGSRSRMPNQSDLALHLATADVALYCVFRGDTRYSPREFVEDAQWLTGPNEYTRSRMFELMGCRRETAIPLIICQTASDLGDHKPRRRKKANPKKGTHTNPDTVEYHTAQAGIEFVKCSAVTGDGVEEVFNTCLEVHLKARKLTGDSVDNQDAESDVERRNKGVRDLLFYVPWPLLTLLMYFRVWLFWYSFSSSL